MEREKTGALIAAARKEKNLTQRELAKSLHVSDRAVSKWERGAGFPDVGLLEPLGSALGLSVLDLLRGERGESINVDAAVREALAAFQEKHRRDRRDMWKELGKVCLFLLIAGAILSYLFPLRTAVDRTIPAGVYEDGALLAYTDVELRGDIEHTLLTGRRGYWGRFAIGCVEWTCREEAKAGVTLKGEAYSGLTYAMSGVTARDLYDISMVISPDMTEFAFALQAPSIQHDREPRAEHWVILTTSPEAYETYRAQFPREGGSSPPALVSPHPEALPDFPSAWKRW